MRQARTLFFTTMLAASACLLAACGGSEAPVETTPVTGSWRLETYLDDDQLKPLLPGSDVTAEFGTELVSGNAGVNDFSASYSLEGDRIDFGRFTVTEDEGAEDFAAQEKAFLEDLERARTYSVEGTQGPRAQNRRLTLRNRKGEVLVTFVQGLESELVGAWTCTGYSGGKAGLEVPRAGAEPSADFGEGGALSGLDGSGSYLGTYETTGDGALSVTDIETVGDTDERSPEAERFTDALQAATSYELGEGTLTLKDASGRTVATFERAE